MSRYVDDDVSYRCFEAVELKVEHVTVEPNRTTNSHTKLQAQASIVFLLLRNTKPSL